MEAIMAPRVLVSDALSETAVQIFRDRGVEVDFQPKLGKDKEKLLEIIGQYDGLAIRSATKATEKLIAAATNLKVIGRAGIGVDNVDIPAASRRGIIVMNTPFGNSITTAEHAIALMFAVARQLPAADASTQAGKWEKSKFMGVEITGKTLGVIGAGNIGGIVCRKAIGLGMHVLAYDPFLSRERAEEMGVTKVELDELLARADFITLHVPMTDKTRGILNAEAIARTKPGVRIINCARGGLVDEAALAEAIRSGHVAGAGFDVFETEPATESPLFGLENVVCTPHLGRLHHGSAGERGAAGGRADVGLPDPRRGLQRHQHAVDHRGGSPDPQALHPARRRARLLCRPGHRKPDQGDRDPL
jgi:D-3-phosphoglycerate dehydrogenase